MFADASKGKHFAACKFVTFLELLNAGEGTVEAARVVEAVRPVATAEETTAVQPLGLPPWDDYLRRTGLGPAFSHRLRRAVDLTRTYLKLGHISLPDELASLLAEISSRALAKSQRVGSLRRDSSSSSRSSSGSDDAEEVRGSLRALSGLAQALVNYNRVVVENYNAPVNLRPNAGILQATAEQFVYSAEALLETLEN